jgi:hypothetical protein
MVIGQFVPAGQSGGRTFISEMIVYSDGKEEE